MKAGFVIALLGAIGWFGTQVWPLIKPHVQTYLEDRRIRERKEQLRLERERDRTADER